jgi:hypothetical protein
LSNGINYTKKGGSIQVNLILMEEQLIKSKKDQNSNVSMDDLRKNQKLKEDAVNPKIVHLTQNLSNQTPGNSNRSMTDESEDSNENKML